MSRRTGTTLIEVIAGLALLGTLLASLLMLRTRYIQRSGEARRELEAITLADQLAAGWWADRDRFPRELGGELQESGMTWRVTTEQRSDLADWRAEAVRLELIEARAPKVGRVLVRLELALPDRKALLTGGARK